MLAEPARMASVTGLVDRWWRHHEVSIPIAAVADAGWCLGWQPRAKVSMMIMRPPQHRQGRGSTRGWSARKPPYEPEETMLLTRLAAGPPLQTRQHLQFLPKWC